jgi:hypothetical protein
MKKLLTILALTLSVASYAQERIVMDSETALINSTEATLVRTAETPDKVTVYFNVPMTRNVCTRYVRARRGRSTSSRCVEYAKVTTNEADKVKISFKNLPALGGTEEDTFKVTGRQRGLDRENVVYEVSTIKTTLPYIIISKGILGYDSYSVELK